MKFTQKEETEPNIRTQSPQCPKQKSNSQITVKRININ